MISQFKPVFSGVQLLLRFNQLRTYYKTSFLALQGFGRAKNVSTHLVLNTRLLIINFLYYMIRFSPLGTLYIAHASQTGTRFEVLPKWCLPKYALISLAVTLRRSKIQKLRKFAYKIDWSKVSCRQSNIFNQNRNVGYSNYFTIVSCKQ